MASFLNKKVKAGFTLVELLVVLSISAILVASLGSGIVNMQSTVKLDNTIRDMKLSIQTTQNQARNSFLTYNRTNLTNLSGSFFQGGVAANNISLGWMISFQNVNNDTILVTRRSVFFKPSGSYDFERLRDEIVNFRDRLNSNLLTNKKFECDSSGNFKIGNVNQTNYASIINGINFSVNCAYNTPDYTGSEYFESRSSNVRVSLVFGTNALPSCWESNNPGAQQSIFFTSGYGEPVLNVNSATGFVLRDCQLQVQYAGFINTDVRALKVSKDNGSVELCGSFCTN